MKRTYDTKFRILYGLVACGGMVVLLIAAYQLIRDQASLTWLVLSLLTLVAGFLSLKIPGVNGRVCVGEMPSFV